jgi:predicted permease
LDKTKLLKADQSDVLSKTLQYVGLPFLVLNTLLGVSFNGELLKVILISAAIGVGYMMFLFFLSYPLSKGEKSEKARGMMQFCCICTNNGFLGIPLAAAVFPNQQLVITSLVIINIISIIFFNTFGIFLVSGDKSAIQIKKAVANPVLIVFVLGIVFSLLGVGQAVPEISAYAGYLGGLVTPLCMIILGMKLGSVSFGSLFKSWKTYYVAAIKLIFVPVLITGVAIALYHVFSIAQEIVFGTFIAFALPSATLGIVFADNYHGDTENGVAYTLGNTVISVATIPLLYGLLVLAL